MREYVGKAWYISQGIAEQGRYGEMRETGDHHVVYVRASREERADILALPPEGDVPNNYVSIGREVSTTFKGKLLEQGWSITRVHPEML